MKTTHTVVQEGPDLWRFNEAQGERPYVDSYLLIGTERAVLIDALQSEQEVSLVDEVRSRTCLPVDVLLTHGHPDHAGAEVAKLASAEGFTVYMSHLDMPIYSGFSGGDISNEKIHDIREGDIWDLGNMKLIAYQLAGHTPGSFVFVDFEGNRAFAGDVFGLWMQLPHSLPLTAYFEDLKRFEEVIADTPEMVFYTGHLPQSQNKPRSVSVCREMHELCQMIIDGAYEGEPVPVRSGSENDRMAELMKGARSAKYNSVRMMYRPDRIK